MLRLAACGMGHASFSPVSARYDSFFTPADHIDRLPEHGYVQAVDHVLANQGAILGQDADTLTALTAELDAALFEQASTELSFAREGLAPAAWPRRLFSAPNFFGLYPVDIEPADFFKQHADLWQARVRYADVAGLARLFEYCKSVPPAELKAELAHRCVEVQAATLSGGGTPGLAVMLTAAKHGVSVVPQS